MSADNYALIKRHPNGGFAYVIACASDDAPDLSVYPTDSQFDTLQDAVQAARDEDCEYGYSVDDECWVPMSAIGRALGLGDDDGFDLPELHPWGNYHVDGVRVQAHGRFVENFEGLQQRPQRQDSLTDQLRTLYHAANRLGCYDAADFIWRHVTK